MTCETVSDLLVKVRKDFINIYLSIECKLGDLLHFPLSNGCIRVDAVVKFYTLVIDAHVVQVASAGWLK
jgi:hypothetical protein